MEIKISRVNFSPRFNTNEFTKRPYLIPLGYDTISFCRKQKLIAEQKEADVIKSFSKKGVRKEEITEILKEDWKRRLLEEYLLSADPKKHLFSKKPTPREMLFGIQNRLSSEELNRYIQFTNERKSNKTGIILSQAQANIAAKNKLNIEQAQRALEITENKNDDDKTPLTFEEAVIAAKYNISDNALKKYSSLIQSGTHQNIIESDIFKHKERLETFERLSSPDSKFNKDIDVDELFALSKKSSSDEYIEEYIKYKNHVLSCGKTAYEVIKQHSWSNPAYLYKNISLENLDYFANYIENSKEEREQNKDFNYFNLHDFENENNLPDKINRIIKPDKNGQNRFSKPLNWAHICIAARNNLKDEQIEKLLTITDEKEAKKIGLSHPVDYSVAQTLISENASDEAIKYVQNTLDKKNWHSRLAYDVLKSFSIYKAIQKLKNSEEIQTREARSFLKTVVSNPYQTEIAIGDNTSLIDFISELGKMINISEKALNQDEQTQALNGIKNIQTSIKSVDLNNCEIKIEENGSVSVSNNPQFEKDLNDILVGLPEFKNTIGRLQQGEHAYTVDKHMLKVLQNIANDPEFEKLNNSDKKVLTIAGLMHDLSKKEGVKDREHADDSAFDTYYILQRLDIENFEKIKIYNLIKTHHWLENVCKAKDREKTVQDIAYDLRSDNEFEMSKILCKADLGAVRADNSFYLDFKELYDDVSTEIEDKVNEIRKTQIFMPQTKFPKASDIKNGKIMKADGIKNTVLVMDELKNDLSLYGFEEGCTKENFRTFLHGFDSEGSMVNFNEFNIVDSDAVLSTCYINSTNYRVFRQYGFLIDVENSNIHAGLPYDYGTWLKKNVEHIKADYIYSNEENRFTKSRKYMPNLIKNKANLADEEYIEKIKNLRGCKSYSDIKKKDPDFAKVLNNVFYDMESRRRSNNRWYNEFLCSNPNVKAVYSYDKKYEEIPLFLRKYAADNDLPIIMFGEC